MIRQVQSFIEQWNMIGPGDTVVAGVSGGADSVCLCLVLQELSVQMGFAIRVVHVEHGIRGEASRRDAAFVRELCARLGLSFSMHEAAVPAFAKEHHMSTEEAARVLRYRAFEQEARSVEAGRVRIALAHHMEDNAETMLLQMVRGTGLDGLCGMRPVRAGESAVYIRPLLETSRRDIEEFLERRGQNYCEDATNSELAYSRNRIRHRVIPELAAVNAQAVWHMNQAAGRLAELRDYIDCEAERAYETAVERHTVRAEETENAQGGEMSLYLRKDVLDALPQVIRQRVIHRAVTEVSGAKRDIAAPHIRAVQGLLEAQTGHRVDLPNKTAARREYAYVILWRDRGHASGVQEVRVTADQLADCAASGTAIAVSCGEDGARIELCAFPYEGNPLEISSKMYTKWFDYDKIKDGFSIRTREKGDYFVLDSAGHHKKLERYFIDLKLTQSQRERFLVLARGSEVLWAIGGRMGQSAMITESTRTVLEVVYKGGAENGLQQKA